MSSSNPILISIVIILLCCYEGESIKTKNTRLSLNVTMKEMQRAINQSTLDIIVISSVEKYLVKSNITVKPNSPSYGQLLEYHPSIHGMKEARNAEIIDRASQYIMHRFIRNRKNIKTSAKILATMKFNQTSQGKICLSEYYNDTLCNGLNLKYRTADGSCNNKNHIFWGRSNTAYKRLLFPDYTDSISSIKMFPNPRELSTGLVKNEKYLEFDKTIAMTIWGIFIGHDLTHTGVSSMLSQNKAIECCSDSGNDYSLKYLHPFCETITIPDNDTFFGPLGRSCLNYVRSIPAMRSDCTFGPREQLNQVTHYLDASMIYGSTEKQTLSLRKKSQGLLMNEEFMPMVSGSDMCMLGSMCYRAGDHRANSHPQLTTMYTLWLREHNRIAGELAKMNPKWNDEKTFQETRKIIIALIQHITYNEWLPLLIGPDNLKKYNLKSLHNGYSTLYDSTIDPSVSNSFATAILPFTDSMSVDTILLYNRYRMIQKQLFVEDHFYRPGDLQIKYFDELIRGMAIQNPQKVDMMFSEHMTNYMYSNNIDDEFGMDIVSLGIQRTRDHGIPSYTEFRKYCNLSIIKKNNDLSNIMVEGAASKLLQHYEKLDDIDLIIGALFEKHEKKSMVGPTMRCLIVDQFKRTKQGDIHFYEFPNVFEKEQLKEIRKMTLSRLFCDNSDTLEFMEMDVFLKTNISNLILCSETSLIRKVNLKFWNETYVQELKNKQVVTTTTKSNLYDDSTTKTGDLLTTTKKSFLTTTTPKGNDEKYYPKFFFNGVG